MKFFTIPLKRLIAVFLFVLSVPVLADSKNKSEPMLPTRGEVLLIMEDLVFKSGEDYIKDMNLSIFELDSHLRDKLGESYQNNRHLSILNDSHWLRPLSNSVAYNIDKGLAPICELEEQAKEILSQTIDTTYISLLNNFLTYSQEAKNEIMASIDRNTTLIYQRCYPLESLLKEEGKIEEGTEITGDHIIAYSIQAECQSLFRSLDFKAKKACKEMNFYGLFQYSSETNTTSWFDDYLNQVLNNQLEVESSFICAEKLKENSGHTCWKTCSKIYSKSWNNNRYVGNQCKKLSLDQIENLEEVYENLNYPNKEELVELELYPESLKTYLDISISDFVSLINDYLYHDAETIFLWLLEGFIFRVETDNAFFSLRERTHYSTEIITKNEDRDYSILSALLQKIYPEGNTEDKIHEYFTKIELGQYALSLMELAITYGNQTAINWFMDFIEDKTPACNDNRFSKGCFEVYCRMGAGLNSPYDFRIESGVGLNVSYDPSSDYSEKWLIRSEKLESYLNSIIRCFNRDGESCSDFRPSNWTINKEDDNYIEEADSFTTHFIEVESNYFKRYDPENSWMDLCEKVL